MLEQIIHRGPNQSDVFINEEIVIGFRRLSIIDVENGSQPLFNETFFKNVFKLPPAHYFTYKNEKMEIKRY